MLLAVTALVAANLTPQAIAKLEAGEVITRVEKAADSHHKVGALGLIDAPPERVWSVFTDFSNYKSVYTGISQSKIKKTAGSTLWGYFNLAFPWPLPNRWTLNETHLDHEHLAFNWKRVDGTVQRYEGSLHLGEWPHRRTLVDFEATMDPGLPWVPEWLTTYVQRTTLPAIIQGPRDYLSRTASAR